MADDMITAMTTNYFLKDLVNNIFDSNALLSRMKEKERTYDGGRAIQIPLMNARAASSGSFTGYGLLDTQIADFATDAQFDWRHYYVTLGWSREDFLKNASSKARIVDLVEASTTNASETMQYNLTTGLFQTSRTATEIDGFATAMVAAATTAWGGLSSSDFTTWQPGGAAAGRDTTTTTISLSALNTVIRQCSDGNDKTTVIVTTDAIFTYIYNLLTPNQQFVNTTNAKTGFTELSLNGIPVITDKNCTANYIYVLNEKHFWWGVHEKENMRYEKPKTPVDQATSIGQIFWYGNLVGDSRRRQGVLTAITG